MGHCCRAFQSDQQQFNKDSRSAIGKNLLDIVIDWLNLESNLLQLAYVFLN